jgi:hypothetical protein
MDFPETTLLSRAFSRGSGWQCHGMNSLQRMVAEGQKGLSGTKICASESRQNILREPHTVRALEIRVSNHPHTHTVLTIQRSVGERNGFPG